MNYLNDWNVSKTESYSETEHSTTPSTTFDIKYYRNEKYCSDWLVTSGFNILLMPPSDPMVIDEFVEEMVVLDPHQGSRELWIEAARLGIFAFLIL